MKFSIQRWNRPEPTLKLKFYRFIQPYAGLLDSIISIVTLSQFGSNFELKIAERHAYLFFQYKKSQQNK